MQKIAKRIAKTSDKKLKESIKDNMMKDKENGKFKIICFKAPRWLAFLLRKFCKGKA